MLPLVVAIPFVGALLPSLFRSRLRLDPALPRAELIRARAAHVLAKAELVRQQQLGRSSVASESVLDRAAAEVNRLATAPRPDGGGPAADEHGAMLAQATANRLRRCFVDAVGGRSNHRGLIR